MKMGYNKIWAASSSMMSTIEYFNFKFNLRAIFSVVVFENGYASIKFIFILVLYILTGSTFLQQ